MGRNSPKYAENTIVAFMMYSKNSDISKHTGLSDTTVRRYRKDPAFQAVLTERRDAMLAQVTDKLRSALIPAADTLMETLQSKTASDQVRINAANAIFTHARALIETQELLSRVEKLEAEKANIERILWNLGRVKLEA